MRCDNPQYIKPQLPEGFYFDTYRDGDDEAWAKMEHFAGDFKNYAIALGYFRSAYLLPGVVKAVRQRFPGVKVRLVEMGSAPLRKEAAEGVNDSV